MMQYVLEGTTKRYQGNDGCRYPKFTPQEGDLYHYGCEFEFYIDTKQYLYSDVIDALTKTLYELTSADILVDEISIPHAADKNHCMQIKPDISLEDHGVEISVPISTKEGVLHYIQTILPLIEHYGYTNEETGFHIHMSTLGSSHIDFYRFMLLCDDAGLLSAWKPRIGYSQNVMDILASHTKQEARIIKTKKGTIWNLERIDSHHIEIKSIGGADYHKETERLMREFELYADYFTQALGEVTPEHKRLLENHKQMLDSLDKEAKGRFASALIEAGILGK
jgi:hypothetical protein